MIVSSDGAGTPGDYGSSNPAITPDGRYVAFESVATNLVSPVPPATISEVYRKDLLTGEVVLVSSDSKGAAGDDNSYDPSISSDGRFVAFFSYALNLISPAAQPDIRQVYRKDLHTGEVSLVSSDASGQIGDGWSHFPSISSDGSLVAFMSVASNLVFPAPPSDVLQIYRKNMDTGEIVLVSTNSSEEAGNCDSSFPSISSDGRYIAFDSCATNLVSSPLPADTYQVYRRDLYTGEVTLASTNASGQAGDGNSYTAFISSDGRYIAFCSSANNLIYPAPPVGVREVYRKDFLTDEIVLITTSASGQPGNDNSDLPSLSSDGRYAVFESRSTNLISPSPPTGISQTYRKDLQTGEVELTSSSTSGKAGDDNSGDCSINSNGHYVAFFSAASNLVSPSPPAPEVYRKKLQGE